MNKSEIAGRVADRAGVGRLAVGGAVDARFEAIAEALAWGEDVGLSAPGSARPERGAVRGRASAGHIRIHRGDLQSQQAYKGCFERGQMVMGMTGDQGQAGTGGAAVEFGRLPLEDSARSGRIAALREIMQG